VNFLILQEGNAATILHFIWGCSVAAGVAMYRVKLIRPGYAERFQCIGAECEDTCCWGWNIPVDEASYRKYQSLPEGPLQASIQASLERTPAAEAASGPLHYAAFKILPSGACPMFTEARLCRIHAELGPDSLCRLCQDFPRVPRRIDDLEEQPLSLSCPEAARLVLLAEPLLAAGGGPEYTTSWDEAKTGIEPLRNYFWAIRDFTIRLIVRQDYPLWQRLFLLGTFSRRLDAFARGEAEQSVLHFIREFGAALDVGKLNAAMEGIRPDLETQLEMVQRLIGLNMRDASPRLGELVALFARGIGPSRKTRRDEPIARYRASYQNVYKPFFERHPQMLENYLVNYLFGSLFPFGPQLTDPAAIPKCAEAFAALVVQFALLKGVLIGVAGCDGEGFSADRVVAAVQILSRHFEHNPRFLADATALLDERKMNNAAGLTTLLRN
jgi:lysine-N-methylase